MLDGNQTCRMQHAVGSVLAAGPLLSRHKLHWKPKQGESLRQIRWADASLWAANDDWAIGRGGSFEQRVA
jgi:hypothetical protein